MYPAIIPGDTVQIWVNGDMVHQAEACEVIEYLIEGQYIKANGVVYEFKGYDCNDDSIVELECVEIVADFEF